jgi:hypothetical protein
MLLLFDGVYFSDYFLLTGFERFRQQPIPVARRGVFTLSNDFYLRSFHLKEGGGGVSTLWDRGGGE